MLQKEVIAKQELTKSPKKDPKKGEEKQIDQLVSQIEELEIKKEEVIVQTFFGEVQRVDVKTFINEYIHQNLTKFPKEFIMENLEKMCNLEQPNLQIRQNQLKMFSK